MKNQLKKTLSIVLMACMLLSAVPVWASAAEDTSTAEVPQEQTLSTSQAEPAARRRKSPSCGRMKPSGASMKSIS